MTANRRSCSFTSRTASRLQVVEGIAGALRAFCEAEQARIEFIDTRHTARLSKFSFRHPYLVVAGMPSSCDRRLHDRVYWLLRGKLDSKQKVA
jgi:hypothetical protein